jgi:hypothetical protein
MINIKNKAALSSELNNAALKMYKHRVSMMPALNDGAPQPISFSDFFEGRRAARHSNTFERSQRVQTFDRDLTRSVVFALLKHNSKEGRT